jgi:catechol 2,3-dioxygenase-like lactoylglutathione lyase family enzyme
MKGTTGAIGGGNRECRQQWRMAIRLFLFAFVWTTGAAYGRALEIHAIALTVSDLDRSVAFYERALGFREVGERVIGDEALDRITESTGARVRRATLRLGDESIELDQYLSPSGAPLPLESRSNDLWFQHFAIVVRDMDRAYAHLGRFPHQSISTAPQTIPESNAAAAGIRAYKFRDPDGHPLELLYFPTGKGKRKWHEAGDALFLGIDHSAIAVGDTERSLGFWRDVIGLSVEGGGVNSGPTQERLDGAIGAVVRITGLHPDRTRGPGLEFLQYVMPAGGRSSPGYRPSDIAHVHVVVEVDDFDAAVDRLMRADAGFVSPRPIQTGGGAFTHAVMVKDPDGHAVLLVQR